MLIAAKRLIIFDPGCSPNGDKKLRLFGTDAKGAIVKTWTSLRGRECHPCPPAARWRITVKCHLSIIRVIWGVTFRSYCIQSRKNALWHMHAESQWLMSVQRVRVRPVRSVKNARDVLVLLLEEEAGTNLWHSVKMAHYFDSIASQLVNWWLTAAHRFLRAVCGPLRAAFFNNMSNKQSFSTLLRPITPLAWFN